MMTPGFGGSGLTSYKNQCLWVVCTNWQQGWQNIHVLKKQLTTTDLTWCVLMLGSRGSQKTGSNNRSRFLSGMMVVISERTL